MKKRIKIFETGMYPQGVFDKERVKNIFGNIKDNIQGIFSHTSQWTEDKEAVELGDFSNIEIVDKGHKSEVYADVKGYRGNIKVQEKDELKNKNLVMRKIVDRISKSM